MESSDGEVPVGPATIAGGGVGLVAFVSAGVALVTGAATTEEIIVFGSGVVLLVTAMGGRYAQAAVQILAAALDSASRRPMNRE